ncbi:MAG: DEAD/DEAH box helicase [Ectothiorhodospiraceae bacterium]|nr:DEAD/DEAH box helicase [Ectothiorhodospiraceae bacterium]
MIGEGDHELIAAPTGSGKTLATFLAAIDALVHRGLEHDLPDETAVLYVSSLRALTNDIQRNLQVPLAGIVEQLAARALQNRIYAPGFVPGTPRLVAWSGCVNGRRIRTPHIVVTTPESLYILHRDLDRAAFDDVLQMLADGYPTRRGRRGAYLHRDWVNGRLRHTGPVRLRRGAAAGRNPGRYRQRGLRLREHAGRYLPTGQHGVSLQRRGVARDASRKGQLSQNCPSKEKGPAAPLQALDILGGRGWD